MIRFIGHLDVGCSPDYAFELLADMTDLDRWNPNVTSSRRIEGDRFEPGSRYESIIVRGPMRMRAESTLVDVEPGRRVRYEGAISIFWSVDELNFEATEQGCRITFSNESRGPEWLRLLEPLFDAAFQPQARKAVVGARRHLERN
ncbi:MAG: SRPBCC family protein [Acidimicrobiia bacterium]|nr:SRPBCC family protein [Acidimicrobiia bacterium]